MATRSTGAAPPPLPLPLPRDTRALRVVPALAPAKAAPPGPLAPEVRATAAAADAADPTVEVMPVGTLPHPWAGRARWFLLGLAAGAVLAIAARGEGRATLHDLREWSAQALRSLERRPDHRPRSSAPSRLAPPGDPPCSADTTAEGPCAELLAPFREARPTLGSPTTPAVRTVPVESLPVARAPVVHRRHARPAPALLPPGAPTAPTAPIASTPDTALAQQDDAPAKDAPTHPDVELPRHPGPFPAESTAENDLR